MGMCVWSQSPCRVSAEDGVLVSLSPEPCCPWLPLHWMLKIEAMMGRPSPERRKEGGEYE